MIALVAVVLRPCMHTYACATSISAAWLELVPVDAGGPWRVTNSLNVRFQIAPASSWP